MMDTKQVLSFIKIEHTLFSLPFVLIGYFIAIDQFDIAPGIDLLWILLAAVGARGLAMALNRIIDRDIDAASGAVAFEQHLVVLIRLRTTSGKRMCDKLRTPCG